MDTLQRLEREIDRLAARVCVVEQATAFPPDPQADEPWVTRPATETPEPIRTGFAENLRAVASEQDDLSTDADTRRLLLTILSQIQSDLSCPGPVPKLDGARRSRYSSLVKAIRAKLGHIT